MRDRIEWLKSKGICVACGQEKAREGILMCQKCATKNNECHRKRLAKRSEENG
jgi:predicted nucleotidyltransferase